MVFEPQLSRPLIARKILQTARPAAEQRDGLHAAQSPPTDSRFKLLNGMAIEVLKSYGNFSAAGVPNLNEPVDLLHGGSQRLFAIHVQASLQSGAAYRHVLMNADGYGQHVGEIETLSEKIVDG